MANKKAKRNGEESRKKIYDFIVSYVSKNNYAPSVREIADGTGFKSSNTVHTHLHKLQEMGVIELGGFGNPRAIKIKGHYQKDLVEVIRCRACKHWGTGVAGETEHVKCCEYGKYMVGKNGYCVYGELKEESEV